jgi:hypothetical protein
MLREVAGREGLLLSERVLELSGMQDARLEVLHVGGGMFS